MASFLRSTIISLLLVSFIPSEVSADTKIGQCPANGGGLCAPGEGELKEKQASSACEIHADADFPGEDLTAAEHVESPERCSKVCHETSGCKAWTFVREGQAHANGCYLKRSPILKDSLRKDGCCDSGSPCAAPKFKKDPLRTPAKQREMTQTAWKVADLIFLRLAEVPMSVLALLVLGLSALLILIQLLGNHFFARTTAPMKVVDDGEAKAVLTQDDLSLLATRRATVLLPLSYAPVLGAAQWEGVDQVRYSYKPPAEKKEGSGGFVEVCASVKERSRECDERDPLLPVLTMRTTDGVLIRIKGEEATLLDAALGEAPVAIEDGSLVCPLLHLEDKMRLAKAAEELYKQTPRAAQG